MEDLLDSYIGFIEAEMDNEKNFDPDRPIKEQFDEILDEMDFRIATIKFEIDVFLDTSWTADNSNMTLQELVNKLSALPKISKQETPAFIKRKKAELAKIAQKMAADLQGMFG